MNFSDRGDLIDTLELIKKISPEIIHIIEKRYLILRSISYNQPIGRRVLSLELGIKERAIRDEVTILKNQGLINIDFMGMYVTEDGYKSIADLQPIYSELKGIPELEEKLRQLLKIKKARIIPGDSSENRIVLKDMGKTTSKVLKTLIKPKDIIGITGGNTMATFAEEFITDNKSRDIVIIPARGGLGRNVEVQSNSIAAKLAGKLGGSYRLLYAPDGLDEEALEIILKNKEIKESIELINNMDSLIFGIGRADDMAERRNIPQTKIEKLTENGAVAEAFGHYFDIKGREIWEYKTIGLTLDKFKTLNTVIGVAGGKEKAQAIIAISTLNKDMILITDESAAREILKIEKA